MTGDPQVLPPLLLSLGQLSGETLESLQDLVVSAQRLFQAKHPFPWRLGHSWDRQPAALGKQILALRASWRGGAEKHALASNSPLERCLGGGVGTGQSLGLRVC